MQNLWYNLKGWLTAILIVALPPVGLAIKRGIGYYFWVCLLLCFLGYFPAVLYAAYRTFHAPDETLYEVRMKMRE